MKILQINKFFWNKGGSETYFFELSKLLEQQGHQVIPFSMQDSRNHPSPYSDFFVPQIDFQSHKKPLTKAVQFLYSQAACAQLTKLLQAEQPDLAHVHNIAHQLTPAILPVLKKFGVPVVQTLHDYQLICPNYKLYTNGAPCERCFKHKYYNAALNHCVQDSAAAGALAAIEMTLHKLVLKSYDAVDLFICPSQFLFDRLVAWGIPKAKLVYIPNFVSTQETQAVPKKDFILFAGRLTKEKGIEVLLESARQLPEQQFVIAGTAETQEQNTAFAKSISTLPNVEWKGQITDSTVMRQLMAETRALIIPSEWYENAPLVVLEALATGTWVLTSDRGGLPELLEPGKNGVLFRAGSAPALVTAIQQLENLPEKPTIPLNPKFTSQLHLPQILAVYKQLQAT